MTILRETISDFRSGSALNAGIAELVFDAILTEADESVLVELLETWNEKGIVEDEIFALATIMRSRMKRITPAHDRFVDAVGTGGSRVKTFNVSTAAAFVVAGSDVPVAKHGNRAASSKTGSADLLSELGVRVDVDAGTAERNLNEVGICFMFAPKFHSLSRVLANARRVIGVPTIFNCLGPICNPAGAPYQLIGAWDRDIARSLANVLARLGTIRSWVVSSEEGLDEISLSSATTVYDVCCGNVKEIRLSPEEFGIEFSSGVPTAATSAESAYIVRNVIERKAPRSPAEQIVVINAAAAIYVSGKAASLTDALEIATESVDSGNAAIKLQKLREATNI
jgi:anthranilate phosphoribosyltransferase